jgi:alkylation response protein AidB-like acyl-CoA dehydrogenase
MIIGGVSWYASLLPDRGQEEILADAHNSRSCSSAAAGSRGKRVEGGFASKLLREAIDTLSLIGGVGGFAQSSPIQRMWRDASTALRHALLTSDPSLEIYGRALLGAEGNITPFV